MTNKSQYRSEYNALRNAVHRCHAPKNKQFGDYGGRGIAVCAEWRDPDGFNDFLAHIGPKPCPSLSLDRIDNDQGYQPGNVRWSDRQTQQRNRRLRASTITIAGIAKTIGEWSQQSGVPTTTIAMRVRGEVCGLDLISSTRLPRETFSPEERARDRAGKLRRLTTRSD